MSVGITNFGDKTVAINALFVQPTFYCALNCSGCYVKGGLDQNVKNQKEIDRNLLIDIVWSVNPPGKNARETNLYLNQITFAVDYLDFERDNSVDLYLSFESWRKQIVERKKDDVYGPISPEFHITIFDMLQVERYVKTSYSHKSKNNSPDITSDQLLAFYKPFDLISISHLKVSDRSLLDSFMKEEIKINWNFSPDSSSINQQVQKVKEILPHVSSMYYILHKPDLGLELDKKSTKNFFELWKALKKELSPVLFAKINMDGCVQDAKKYVDTGFGCSSNVSRFQIVPGGHVSGCPYTHRPTTGPSEDFEGLTRNIREAKKVYEFNRCQIPKGLHPEHPQFIEDEYPYLRILQ